MQINAFDYLIHTADRYPNERAFSDENRSVTFSDLLREAEAIGTALARSLPQDRNPIVVLTRRDTASVTAFMGVLSCGRFYAPIDAAMPEERLLGILSRLGPAAVLYGENDTPLAERLRESYPVLSIAETVTTDPCRDELDAARRGVIDQDPAYVLFTSGSTGRPKGIVVSHRALIDFTDWYAGVTGVGRNDRLGNQAPFFFDLSVKDVYLTLKIGAETWILPKKCFMFPVLLVQALNDHGITTLSWSTSAFHMAADSGVFENHVPQTLRRVLVGGEAMRAKQLNIWRKAMPNVQFFNLYGPTEATVDCTYYPIRRQFEDDEVIPIGKACANKEVMLLGEDGLSVADGEPGEICVRGSGLAGGYWGDPELTRIAFTEDARHPEWHDRIYHTGDIGRRNCDGDIEFVSRKDDQIKHLGYRIELGEIENALCALPEVSAAVCLFDPIRDRIVCIYRGSASVPEIIRALRRRLPRYMLPHEYHSVERMPYTSNGKIDRVLLKKNYIAGTDADKAKGSM